MIAPVQAARRPLWSVMIPTYDGTAYLREALGSVLAQDPGSDVMQIEVVDDHSAQDVRAVVADLAGDRVHVHRQPRNRGFIANFETCLQRASGRLVHLLHDDDCVRPGFYAALERGFAERPEVGAAFCRHIYMDEDGHWDAISPLEQRHAGVLDGWLERIAAGQRLTTPSIAVRRAVYERLGGFDRRMSVAGEDWEMWVRIAAHYPVWYDPAPLAAYRIKRAGSLTSRSALTGELIADMRLATDIVASYLPEHLPAGQAARLTDQARRLYAGWAVDMAGDYLAAADVRAAANQVREAVRCGLPPRLALRLVWRLAGGGGRLVRSAGWRMRGVAGGARRRVRHLREVTRRSAR